METTMHYAVAVLEYPTAVQRLMRQLRISQARDNSADPEDVKWTYIETSEQTKLQAKIGHWKSSIPV